LLAALAPGPDDMQERDYRALPRFELKSAAGERSGGVEMNCV
jgi:hypothetical protein